MYKLYQYVKEKIVHFKLERFCCIFPIRVGLLLTGYVYIFAAILSLIGVVEGGITPSLIAVQEEVDEEHVSSALCVLASSAEIMFNSVLLCGMYRNDIKLLRVYIYFVTAAIISSMLVYAIVFATISLPLKLTIISNIVFEIYLILLVRSAIVEITDAQSSEKNGHVTLYSIRTTDDDSIPPKNNERVDVEAAIELKPGENKPIEKKPSELMPREPKTEELKPIETKTNEPIETKTSKPVETKVDVLKPKELKSEGSKPNELKLKELKPQEHKTDELKPKELKADTVRVKEVTPDKVKVKELKTDKLKVKELKPDDLKSGKVNTDEPKPGTLKADTKEEVLQPEEKKDEPETKLETVNEQTTKKKRLKLF